MYVLQYWLPQIGWYDHRNLTNEEVVRYSTCLSPWFRARIVKVDSSGVEVIAGGEEL